MIKGISHIAFKVTDMEKALAFYCGALGLTKAFDITMEDGTPWIEYIKICKGQFIELFYGGSASEDAGLMSGYSHLCLEVEDIQSLAQTLKSKGITIDAGPNQGIDKNWQCWVKDPDGNRIEMMQISSESPQAKA